MYFTGRWFCAGTAAAALCGIVAPPRTLQAEATRDLRGPDQPQPANAGPERKRRRLQRYDTDGDGRLSPEERAAARRDQQKRHRPRDRSGDSDTP